MEIVDSGTHVGPEYGIIRLTAQGHLELQRRRNGAFLDAVSALMRDLRNADNFVFRIDDRVGNELTYQTSVRGFAQAYEYAEFGSCS